MKDLVCLVKMKPFHKRNPGEVFRQFLRYMLTRMDATLANIKNPKESKLAYHRAEDLSADLKTLEQGFNDSKCGNLSDTDIRPLRHMVDYFWFQDRQFRFT